MERLDNQTILLIIVAVTALAMLLQAVILLAIYVSVRKATTALKEEIADFRTAVDPVLDRTRELLVRVGPQVEAAVTDVAAVARGVRVQTVQMEITVRDILDRLHQQSERVDGMISGVLDFVDRAGGFLADAVQKPARQFAGVLASVQAIIESLRASAPAARRARAPEDEDTFV
jgi:hypothetical protein